MAYCDECAKLASEIARLNFELGKAQGELEGLRAEWSVSNHEAWERGYHGGKSDAGFGRARRTQNPFPKPNEKESDDGNG
jgi:hypothetical protein